MAKGIHGEIETIRRPDGLFRLHPTKRCPQCGARLMLGSAIKGEWHCSAIEVKAKDFMAHYEASRFVAGGLIDGGDHLETSYEASR